MSGTIEIFLVGVIILFVAFYNGWVSSGKFVADNKDLFLLLKESDYDFLLYSSNIMNEIMRYDSRER